MITMFRGFSFGAVLAASTAVIHSSALAAGEKDGSSAGLPQMDPTWWASQIFWLALVFCALYIVFARSILPALSGTIEARRDRVQSDLDSARQMKDEAESVHEAYDTIMRDARSKAAELFSSMEEDIKRKTVRALTDIQDKSLEDIQVAEKRLAAEKNKVMAEMDDIAAEVARMAAEKIVGVPTDIEQARSAIQAVTKKAA